MTDVSRQTIRKILKSTGKLLPQNVSIGGPGIIVEIDESKFGKRMYYRGHRVNGAWVLVMFERIPAR